MRCPRCSGFVMRDAYDGLPTCINCGRVEYPPVLDIPAPSSRWMKLNGDRRRRE